MNFLDNGVTTFLNRFAQQSWFFDEGIDFLSHNRLLKGGVLAVMLWWAWFRDADDAPRVRRSVVITLLGAVVAVVLARLLALGLPFRLRPIHEASLGFLPPHGMDPTYLDGWSSFPSDHAVLYFTLATGLLFASRRAGVAALLYSALFIAFPRLYLGLHYLTDILAGAAIGVVIALVGNVGLKNNRLMATVAGWSETRPTLFYPAFFLMTFQIADMFESSRAVAGAMSKVVLRLFS